MIALGHYLDDDKVDKEVGGGCQCGSKDVWGGGGNLQNETDLAEDAASLPMYLSCQRSG